MKDIQPFSLVYGLDPIFKQHAQRIEKVDAEIQNIADRMLKTMYFEGAVGLGANMVGVLKSIAVVDLRENGEKKPYVFINPRITHHSKDTQKILEASLSFPGIDAEIERPKSIKVEYLDYDGKEQSLDAEGFFATVIQHEVDYLNGKTFLDYLSKLKRDTLIKKMEKHMKLNPPHIHGAHCHH
ncbi:MAG UNVERIFIED_CONTAM: peptide deformylase [Rickettsiaceae bacterium]|jgi:peptide deformylase